MTALDNMISGNVNRLSRIPSNQRYGEIILELTHHLLETSQGKGSLTPYLYQTFRTFAARKKSMKINIDYLNKYVEDELLLSSLFNEIKRERTEIRSGWIEWNDISGTQNLMKPLLFKIFPNIEEIEIIITSTYGWSIGEYFYPLSFLSLLSIIENTKIHKVIVTADKDTKYGTYPWLGSMSSSWIEASLGKKSESIKIIEREYKQQQFELKFEYQGQLLITKIGSYKSSQVERPRERKKKFKLFGK